MDISGGEVNQVSLRAALRPKRMLWNALASARLSCRACPTPRKPPLSTHLYYSFECPERGKGRDEEKERGGRGGGPGRTPRSSLGLIWCHPHSMGTEQGVQELIKKKKATAFH